MSFEDTLLEKLAAPIKNAIVGGPFGSNLVSKDYVEEGVPVIRGQNMGNKFVSGPFVFVSADKAEKLAQNKARPGDLVFTQRGTLGQISIVPDGPYEEYIVSQSQMKITLDPEKADLNFIYYLFKSEEQLRYILNSSIQTGVPHTNLGILRKTPVRIPALGVQRVVGNLLSTLDNRIALLRETNTTLEAIAQALFKSWFVDFDPVHANAAFLENGQAPSLPAEIQALFPSRLVESPQGLIPEGWEWGQLKDIASVVMGLSPKGESYNSDGAGVSLINGPVEFGEYFPLKTKWTDSASRMSIKGDMIFCVRGSTTGRRVISDGDYCIGRGVCAIRANNGFNSFIYQTINFGLARLLGKTTGSVFPSLSAPDIKEFAVLNPPKIVLAEFQKLTGSLVNRVQENHHHIELLTSLRDTLLPRLISGQLRLPEAEAALADVS